MGSDSFNNRLKQAASQFSERSKVEEEARKKRDDNRKDFLLSFQDKGINIIEPAMNQVSEYIEHANVTWSDNEDRIALSFGAGDKYALLVFLADTRKMRIRVLGHAAKLLEGRNIDLFQDIQEGKGERVAAIAELTPEQLNAEVVEGYIAGFVEKALGA